MNGLDLKLNNVCNLTRVEDIAIKNTGKRIPCFELGGFINTLEGWNLYVECLKNKDIKPYEEAKERYYERNEVMTA